MYVDVPDEDFQLYAGIDGQENGVLIEYKTGASMWTQEMADESEQITHRSEEHTSELQSH